MGWESVSAIPASAGKQNRKIFISLIEKSFRGRRLKNVKKIFLFCSPSGERKRWAGQSAKSSGFCSKKVLTSSNKHHYLSLKLQIASHNSLNHNMYYTYMLRNYKINRYYIGYAKDLVKDNETDDPLSEALCEG